MSVWGAASAFVVGHRGGRGEGWPPENTLESFDRARVQGALAVELDTRVSADAEAIVFHDAVMARMTRGRDLRRVHDLTFGELRTIELGDGARIPKLADVLSWARSHALGVNVELKYDVPSRIDVVRAAVRIVRQSGADVLLSSFDPLMLAAATAMAPTVPRALLTHAGQPRWATVVQAAIRAPLLTAIHLERTQVSAGPGPISRERPGIRVGVWTVNSPLEAVDFIRRGASWIITDLPGDLLGGLRSERVAGEGDVCEGSGVRRA